MTKNQEIFLSLLRKALWQDMSPTDIVTAENCSAIRDIAVQQSVCGMMDEVILSCCKNIGKQNLANAVVHLNRIMHRSKLVGDEVACLAQLMDKHQIKYVVFKGQVVAARYAKPDLRQAGDIDFYVAKGQFEEAAALIEKEWGVEIERVEDDHHWSFKRNDINYEMHYRVDTLGRKTTQKLFDELMEDDVMNGNSTIEVAGYKVRKFSAELELFHIFHHLFYHLLVEGVGLRQVCDLAITINSNKDLDVNRFNGLLDTFGYTKAFGAFLCIMRKYLGLNTELFADSERYKAKAEKIMQEIFAGGNFGRAYYKNTNPGLKKSIETAFITARHLMKYWSLAPAEISGFVPKRVALALRKYV